MVNSANGRMRFFSGLDLPKKYQHLTCFLLEPDGVIGNTSGFGPFILGSSPSRAAIRRGGSFMLHSLPPDDLDDVEKPNRKLATG